VQLFGLDSFSLAITADRRPLTLKAVLKHPRPSLGLMLADADLRRSRSS